MNMRQLRSTLQFFKFIASVLVLRVVKILLSILRCWRHRENCSKCGRGPGI